MTTAQTGWDDVSNHNPGFKPHRATCAKATEGTTFKDKLYASFKAACAKDAHHFMAYHFLHTGAIGAQASFAHGVIGKTPAMLDVERYTTDGGKSWFVPTLAETVSFIKMYRAAGGVMNVMYLPRWVWSSYWKSASLKPLIDLGVHNINSNYSDGSGASSDGFDAFGGMKPFALQFTSTPYDQNTAYMTWADAWKIWGGTPAVAPPSAVTTLTRTLELTTPHHMTGPDVHAVQVKVGAAHAGAADSDYGDHTKAGVEWWQGQHGLLRDGKVGANTAASMGFKFKG